MSDVRSLKIAVTGKGGVGKTTLSGSLSRYLAETGYKVLAIDADPDANLASAIGITDEQMRGIRPISEMKELVAERTGVKPGTYGGMFILNPQVDDLPDAYSVVHKGVRFMLLGTFSHGGSGCFCPENTLLKALLRHTFTSRNEAVIVDMEAGLEHLGRGTTKFVDRFIIVVEPGKRSFQTARQIRTMATELGIGKICIVGNKVRSDEDRKLIASELSDFTIAGYLPYDADIISSDMKGVAAYDLSPGVRNEMAGIWSTLQQD